MSTYRCPHCQAVVQRAHICARCGAPQPTRHLRSLVIVIASALAIAAFSFATITLQNAGMQSQG
jgi:RNA polymerase subunit RPABC4/transcription elongation factor Spt4